MPFKFNPTTSTLDLVTPAQDLTGYELLANKENTTIDTSTVKYPTVNLLKTGLDTKQNTSEKNIANGYAGLGADNKINPSQLPVLAITDTFVIATEVAMLALTAEVGDIAVRTDLNKTFILKVSPPTTITNWQELLTPTDNVQSVFGRTGTVTAQSNDYTWGQINKTISNLADLTTKSHTSLTDIGTNTHNQIDTHINNILNPHSVTKAQVGLGSVDNTADTEKPISTAQQTALNLKAPLASPTFTTNITTPLIIGGTAVGSNIIYKSTTGVGTATGIAHQFVGGTDGATVAMTVLNNGNVGIGTTNPTRKLDVGGASSIGTIVFTGTGLNDATLGGTYTSSWVQTLRIKITTVGTPDKFDWSIDGGATWAEVGKSITTGAIALNYTGVTVTFGATTGHTLGDYWQATLTQSNGIANTLGGYYIGNSLFATANGLNNTNTLIGIGVMGSGKNTGVNNTANGQTSLYSNTTGFNNTANGQTSLYSNTTGVNNTANGQTSLYSNTTGFNNTAIGRSSLYFNTTGFNNTANGAYSLSSNTTGNYNTANGYASLSSNTTGFNNTANGQTSLYSNTTGVNNTANGQTSLYSNTTGFNNTAIGRSSLYFNTTGFNNTANGAYSLSSNTTGNYNTANGYASLSSNTTGFNNTANGAYSLSSNTTGNNNIAIGLDSGRYQADGTTPLTTVSTSVYIGVNTRGFNNSDNNSIVIGANAIGIGANSVVLGDDSITKTALKGKVGIGTTNPTAVLEIKAGTASANTAPLKLTAGTLNTTPEAGAVEFIDDGTAGHLYITLNVAGVLTRKEIAFI